MLLAVLIFLVVIAMTIWLVGLTVVSVTEEMYMHVFKKPIYVHFYPNRQDLTDAEASILRRAFPFYNNLSEKHQGYFRHRVARFIKKHEFVGKEGFVITDEVRVMVAATAVMLTFGMRRYLFEIVDKIIVYPSVYLSTITNEYHKGEFNPRHRAVVFSWEDFKSGFDANNNLNLGLHEFAHVVHYHGTQNEDSSAILFARMYKRITSEVRGATRQQLIDSNYFRIYAYTNDFEFLAVLVEHYFETPDQFKQEHPKLYRNVELMLNHRHA